MMIRISKSKWMSGRHVYQDERPEENLWPPFRLIKKIMVNSNLYFSNVKKKTNKQKAINECHAMPNCKNLNLLLWIFWAK